MFTLKTDSVNSGYPKLLNLLIEKGETVSPRGQETWEMRPFCWTITNPRKRSFEILGRWKNLGFQLAECIWILYGADDLDTLKHYVPYYDLFSDDLIKLSGAYGKRLRFWRAENDRKVDQFQAVYEKLVSDPYSRQAVMTIFDPAQDYLPTRDVPCTNWMHYTLRNGKLDLTVVMRSNDALWGTPYNVYNFTMFQEIMAGWLNVEIGEYRHIVDCMHIYKDKVKVVERMNSQLLKSIDIYDYCDTIDARMPKFQFEDILYKLRAAEQLSAKDDKLCQEKSEKIIGNIRHPYWQNVGWAIFADNMIRRRQVYKAIKYIELISNEFKYSLLQKACRYMYRWEVSPKEYISGAIRGYPKKLQQWILENPIEELEAIGEEIW